VKPLNLLWIVLLLASPFAAKAQKEDPDSLRMKLQRPDDSIKVTLYIRMSQYYQSRETDSSILYCNKAIALSEKLHKKVLLASAWYRLGNIYNGKGDYTNALEVLQKAYTLSEECGYFKGMTNCANSIGNMYMARQDTLNMLKYFNLALSNAERSGDETSVATVKVGLGNVFQSQKKYDEAIRYFTDAASIFKKHGEYFEMQYTICIVNTGTVYLFKKDFRKAYDIIGPTLPLVEKIGNKYVMALAYAEYGQTFEGLDRPDSALHYYYKALSTAKAIGARDNISEISRYISDCFASRKNADSAYKYLLIFANLRDSIFNEQSAAKTAEMQARYETAEKDKELVKKNAELETSAAQRNTFIIGFALVMALVVFVYIGYRRQKKDKAEINRQKLIIEEKNKDITDSIRYAQNIQGAILPPDDLLYEHLKEHFVLFRSRDIVSGDFYWMHAHEGKVMVGAVDCTGHGVPGALMSVVGYNALRQIVHDNPTIPPAQLLNMLQGHMEELFSNKYTGQAIHDGMDAAICRIDRKNGKLEFAGAHNPVYVISADKFTEIRGDKHSISGSGAHSAQWFTQHEMPLQKGDTIYIFSDGYADQFGGKDGKKFKYSQFKEFLQSISSKPLHEQKKALDDKLEDWKGNLEQIDDVLVIGVRV
jgi:serine phosphatase RsbU (regulator of sigma subunit)